MDDTISRQAAIDIANNLLIPIEEYSQYNQAINNYCFELIKLPSAEPDLDSAYTEGYTQAEAKYRALRDEMKYAQPEIIRCKDCKYRDENWRRVSVRWLPCMDMRTGSNWYCGSADRRTDG